MTHIHTGTCCWLQASLLSTDSYKIYMTSSRSRLGTRRSGSPDTCSHSRYGMFHCNILLQKSVIFS